MPANSLAIYPAPAIRMRLGSASRWNASFDVMPCSWPGQDGISGRAPVAMRMTFAVFFAPLARVISCGPVIVARSWKISTLLFSSVCV